MSTSQLSRKELKQPDGFIEKAQPVVEYINKNSAKVLGFLAVLFVIGLGLVGYSTYTAKKADEAVSALYPLKKNLTAALEKTKPAQPKETQMMGQAPAQLGADWEKATETERAALLAEAAKHPGTIAAFDAYASVAQIFFEKRKLQEAAELYKKAVEVAPAGIFKAQAQHSYAYALEGQGKTDEAIATMKQALSSIDKSLKADALLALARLYETKGDKASAKTQYDTVIREFPNSVWSKAAELSK